MIIYKGIVDNIQKNYKIKNPLVYNSLIPTIMHMDKNKIIHMALKHADVTNIHKDVSSINKDIFKSIINLDLALNFDNNTLYNLTDAILETIIWKNNIVVSYYWYYRIGGDDYINIIKDTLETYVSECVSEMLLDYKLGYYNMDAFALVNDYTYKVVNSFINYTTLSADFYDFIGNLYLNLYYVTNTMTTDNTLYTIPKRIVKVNNRYVLDYVIMLLEGE